MGIGQKDLVLAPVTDAELLQVEPGGKAVDEDEPRSDGDDLGRR
jgi:hypothetical protein